VWLHDWEKATPFDDERDGDLRQRLADALRTR
jgi:hypothetical protein